MSSGLEFFTTKELVDELMRRKTFLGIIIHAEDEHRGRSIGDRVYKVHFNDNLDAPQAGRLLDVIAERMD